MRFTPFLRSIGLWLVLHLSPNFRRRMRARQRIATTYLSGFGLEIGALHMPLPLPDSTAVRYVDYLTVLEQRAMYPELALLPLVTVNLVEDGEALASIADGSVDFVIANHVIEHCENPIGAMENWLRVLRTGGVLYMAVPDKRWTFDRNRPLTLVEHVLTDYSEGPGTSRREHWEDNCRRRNVSEAEINAHIQRSIAAREHPHYHVWTDETFREMLSVCRSQLKLPFQIESLSPLGIEFVVILRKTT